jgi:hypothetical protein
MENEDSGKINWKAISAIAALLFVSIATLVFLFEQGILTRSVTLSTPTLSAQALPTTVTSAQIAASSPETVQLNHIYSASSFTVTVDYLKLENDHLLVHMIVSNGSFLNMKACRLPRLVKSNYGEIGPVVEKGGAFIDVGDERFGCLFPYYIGGCRKINLPKAG